jgi:hypothetical protein
MTRKNKKEQERKEATVMSIKARVRSVAFALALLAIPGSSFAAIIFSISIAPPALPVYDQPLCPGEGYIWTPGYWAYDDADGYFWVPGTWVLVPAPGYLWTPGWWGWNGTVFVFNQGYWGLDVGFYGGINYRFGYVGVGYEGGYWQNGTFFYNRSANNVTNITNVYNKTIIINRTVENISYNGGAGGITARPTAQEERAAREDHIPPIAAQTEHVRRASTKRELFESTNHGRPAIPATAKPGQFSGTGIVRAKAAGPSYQAPSARSAGTGGGGTPRVGGITAVHPKDLPPVQRKTPNIANAKADQKYQQDLQKLQARQQQERQKLQQKQDQEHQSLDKRNASASARQQVEQRHQQQTQQLAQKHAQQHQQLESRQPQGKEEKR